MSIENLYRESLLAGHAARVYELADSTNTRLKAWAEEGAPDGAVAFAREQSAGRGRFDRKWLSKPGAGAWFSILVRPAPGALPALAAADLVFVAALAAAKALNERTNDAVRIKWPNDLVCGGRKIAGMLAEMRADGMSLAWAVVGIGVNLLGAAPSPELPWAATLESACGARIQPEDAAADIVRHFDDARALYQSAGLSAILSEIRPLSATLGKEIRVQGQTEAFTGFARDFADDGALIVDTLDRGQTIVRAGDVSVRGLMGYV